MLNRRRRWWWWCNYNVYSDCLEKCAWLLLISIEQHFFFFFLYVSLVESQENYIRQQVFTARDDLLLGKLLSRHIEKAILFNFKHCHLTSYSFFFFFILLPPPPPFFIFLIYTETRIIVNTFSYLHTYMDSISCTCISYFSDYLKKKKKKKYPSLRWIFLYKFVDRYYKDCFIKSRISFSRKKKKKKVCRHEEQYCCSSLCK